MYVTFRVADRTDLSRLEVMDLKTFDLSWDYQFWESALNTLTVRIALSGFGSVGFWVAQKIPATEDTPMRIDILKIGVPPVYQRQGIGRAILNDIRHWLGYTVNSREQCEVRLQVPESMFEPGFGTSPKDWLNKHGFMLAKPPVIYSPETYRLYGKVFKDIYLYSFPRY